MMGDSSSMHGRHSSSADLAVGRDLGDEPSSGAAPERPLATLGLCALVAAVAFGAPMWASTWFEAPPFEELESGGASMQSLVHTVSVQPPAPGQVIPPRVRLVVVPPEMNACIDPRTWPVR